MSYVVFAGAVWLLAIVRLTSRMSGRIRKSERIQKSGSASVYDVDFARSYTDTGSGRGNT